MKNRFGIALYAVALVIAPAVQAGLFGELRLSWMASFFVATAVLARLTLPSRPWRMVTLIGAAWQDIYLLTPLTTLVAAVVLDLLLTISLTRLAGRTFWAVALTVGAAYGGAVLVLAWWPGWGEVSWPQAVLATVVVIFLAASYQRRSVRRHRYVH